MDFINGCTTNVHVLDSFAATSFIHYTYDATHKDISERHEETHKVIAELRESRTLCTFDNHDIWLFGSAEHQLSENYTVAKEGVVEGQKDAIRFLLEAIEAALAYTLAQEGQLTHIAPWTWMYCNGDVHGETHASIVTLRMKHASSGALYLLPETALTAWSPIDYTSPQASDEVLLAPCGRTATLANDDAKNVIHDEHWKADVAEALKMDGISLDEDEDWTDIALVLDGIEMSCIWPTHLCFVRQSDKPSEQFFLDDSAPWQTWTNSSQGRTYRDPLAEAEEWFLDSADRKRRAADGTVRSEAPFDSNVASGTAAAHDVHMTISPPFMQRTVDQQAAMSGIYPTPPEGLAQQGHSQLGMQIATNSATPSAAQTGEAIAMNEATGSVHDQDQNSSGLDTYPMDEVEEDLFGDVGGEMFEENEVGDADFDYFDEPDDMPAAGAMPGIDTQMTDRPVLEHQSDVVVDIDPHRGEMGLSDMPHDEEHVQLKSSPPSAAVPVDVATDGEPGQQALKHENRALSPFGIRERLLPPPVPASVAHGSGETRQLRRSSSFAPIVFRDGSDLGAKYAGISIDPDPEGRASVLGPNIALPSSRRKNESDDSSDGTGSSDREDDEVEMPPRLPWESSGKRKRKWVTANSGGAEGFWGEETGDMFTNANTDISKRQRDLRTTLLGQLISSASRTGKGGFVDQRPACPMKRIGGEEEEESPFLEELFNPEKQDLICIAQLISEQASTCLAVHPSIITMEEDRTTSLPEALLTKALTDLAPSPFESCDLPRLALTRDSAPAPRVTSRAPVPPRPSSEVPDIFSIPAPYIRIQRNNDIWEMLPPALKFWEPNGLAGVSGLKNVKARAVLPSNNDLRDATRGFLGALGRTYEGCKLGTHGFDVQDDGESDAGPQVEADGELGSKLAMLRGYARTCSKVGKELAVWTVGPGRDWEGTFVVYIIDPFTGAGWKAARQYLCACFWILFQSYQKRLHAEKKGGNEGIVPDVVLQILPVELVAAMDRLIIPDPEMLANLAREVYDRCPASSAIEGEGDGAATPSILLAPPVPKRIAFQLLSDVPAESLLQDGRVLHLAIAMSRNREWMVCVWSNGQGRTLTQESFCLRGVMIGAVVKEAWQQTVELVGRVRVGWRVFVALDEGAWHGHGLERVWRDTIAAGKAGGTTVCVTLAKVRADMLVKLTGEDAIWDGAVGLATPASTPVAFPSGNGAATGTNSPNIGGSEGFGAPLTPAGSDSTVNATAAATMVMENDPDAHLVHVEDESCGVLLKPHFSALAELDGMANGAIVRRGSGVERHLLGTGLCWTLQVKPQGAVDMGSLRQAEVTLREVLKMFRALSVLTRARGLHQGEHVPLPVHLAVAGMGAKALEDWSLKG